LSYTALLPPLCRPLVSSPPTATSELYTLSLHDALPICRECCRPSLSSEKGGFSMTEKEYKEHIQYTHNAYCRIVIRHASIDAARMLFAKWKREISLEYLTEEKFVPLSTTDEYFQVPDYGETYLYYYICGCRRRPYSENETYHALQTIHEHEAHPVHRPAARHRPG